MDETLEIVRNELLAEALASPVLLSDLAGLEAYVGETYAARALIELVQNAEDAGATRLVARLSRHALLVANDGRPFEEADFRALCRSATSTKRRGEGIGYRGIGFKSTVTLGDQILIISGPFQALFSRELTRAVLPGIERVPLVRIPHPIPRETQTRISEELNSAHSSGFRTVFLFESPNADAISGEFADFSGSAMLFLRNLNAIQLTLEGTDRRFSCDRVISEDGRVAVTLHSDGEETLWELVCNEGVSLAFKADQLPASDAKRECVAHAFLPTNEQTGFGIKINGDFDTDPSRTRVVFTERTSRIIDDAAKILAAMLQEALTQEPDFTTHTRLAALVPIADPRATILGKRSFASELLVKLKAHTVGFSQRFRVRPRFLNQRDFESLAMIAKFAPVRGADSVVEPLTQLMRFLGVPELSFDEASAVISGARLSANGCAELLATAALRYSTGIPLPSELDYWPTWVTDSGIVCLNEARRRSLNQGFIDSMVERAGSKIVINNFLSKVGLTDKATVSGPIVIGSSQPQTKSTNDRPWQNRESRDVSRVTRGLTKWRTSEANVKEYFESLGFSVSDVSRQNLGYDLEARSGSGEVFFIEVKSIDTPGQPFVITSNEEAAAREREKSYLLALVQQGATNVQIAVIEDPISKLKFSRQCRQWVWECSDYPFAPVLLTFPQ